MLASQARRFGEALVERHVVTKQTMEAVLNQAAADNEPIDQAIRRTVQVSEKDLACGYAAAVGIGFVDFETQLVHPDAAAMLPVEVVRQHGVLCVEIRDRQLVIAFPMPAQGEVMHTIAGLVASTGYESLPVGADPTELKQAIDETLDGVSVAKHGTHSEPEMRLIDLIERVLSLGGSDLHLAADHPPYVRVLGDLRPLPEMPVLSAAEVRAMAVSVISARQRERFDRDRELDTAYAIPGRVRLRVNLFVQRGAVGAAFRVIPFEVVPLENLGMPPVIGQFADLPRGLVLVTGPTGSGKSTTLASLIDLVNQRHAKHIMTIEDPVEFVHHSKRALVNQREVGDDTNGFSTALTQALRQDPDVILVGEMRDLETVSTAISAAETGHLVFATLHTQDSGQTVDRIVDVFPAEQQSQVRTQVANTLQGIVAQQLVPTADGLRRIPACEVLIATPALRALIRDGKVHQIANTISSGRKLGMQSLDDSLAMLVRAGEITAEAAYRRARDADGLARLLGGGAPQGPTGSLAATGQAPTS